MVPSTVSRRTGATLALVFALILGAAVAVPASAATKYLGGSPVFSASVAGVNEFAPGGDATISILVKNTGVSTMKQLDQGTIQPDDLPTTAKFASFRLTSDSSAITIKSDPQMIGTFPAGGQGMTLNFVATISTNATSGDYTLPLRIDYQYPRVIQQEKADVFDYQYDAAKDTIPVVIRIRPVVKTTVISASPDPLSPGTEGYLRLKIQNTGPENGSKASVKLIRSGSSAIIPTDDTVYIGNFPSGSTADCTFKVTASTDATAQTYPVDVVVSYTDREGAVAQSAAETIGIPVNAKTAFAIVSPEPSIAAGSGATISVQYRNTGNTTAYEAQARITPHSLVTITDNVAYLGDIPPGGSATALYVVKADGAAEPGEYSFDSKVRFRDALGTSIESDTIPVTLRVTPAPGTPVWMMALGLIVLMLVIAGAYYLYERRKNQ